MKICSLRNDNLLSRCIYSDILNRKFPPKKPFRPENSDCAECVTFSLPRIKFNLSSGVFERRTATGSKTSSLFICLDATTFVLISVITLIEMICLKICPRITAQECKKSTSGGRWNAFPSFLSHPLPALSVTPFFARSLTLVPRSLTERKRLLRRLHFVSFRPISFANYSKPKESLSSWFSAV